MATKRDASKVLLDLSTATKRKSKTKSISLPFRSYRNRGLSAVSEYRYGIQRQGRYTRLSEEDVPKRARSTPRDPTTFISKKAGKFPGSAKIRGTKNYNFDSRENSTKLDLQSNVKSVYGVGRKLTRSSSLPQKWLASRKRDELVNYHAPLRSKSSYRDSKESSLKLWKRGAPRTKHRSVSSDSRNFKNISVISRYSSKCVESEAHSSIARRIIEMKKFLRDISKKGSSEVEVTRRQVLVSTVDENVVIMKGYLSRISSLGSSKGNIDLKENDPADLVNAATSCQAVIPLKAHSNISQPIEAVSQVHYASKTYRNTSLRIQNSIQARSPFNSHSDTSQQEINCPCRTDFLSQQQEIRKEFLAGESDTKKDNPFITDILSQKRQIRNDSPLAGDNDTLQDNPLNADIFPKQLQIRNDCPHAGESNTKQDDLFKRDILSQEWQTREDGPLAGDSNTKQNNFTSRKAVILAKLKSPIKSLLDGFGTNASVTQSICSSVSAEESQRTSADFECGFESQTIEDHQLESAQDEWPSKKGGSLNNEQQEICLEPKLSSDNVRSQNEASKQKTNQTVNCQSLCQFKHPRKQVRPKITNQIVNCQSLCQFQRPRKPVPPKTTMRFSQQPMQAHGLQILEDSTRGTADDAGLFMLSDNIMPNEKENFEIDTMSKHLYKAETSANTFSLNQRDTSVTFKEILCRRSSSCPFPRSHSENDFSVIPMSSQIPHGLYREDSDCREDCLPDICWDDSRSSSRFVKRKVRKTFVNAQKCALKPSDGYTFVFRKLKFYFLLFVLLVLCISLAYLATTEYLTRQREQKKGFTEDSMQT